MSRKCGGEALPDHVFTLPLLRSVVPVDRALLSAASRIAIFGADESIYRQGEPSRALAVLLEGRAKLSVPSAHGKELVVSFLESGQSFGEIGFLDGFPRSLDATAILPSRVLLVRREALLSIMARTPALALAFAEATCKRLRRTTDAVQQAIFYNVEERLADCVLQLATTAFEFSPTQSPTLNILQHELAAMVGVTRESINKQLRAWQKQKLICIGRGRIKLINVDGLSRIVATSTIYATAAAHTSK